ncbi:MAG TPA: response regulator [Myxococcales bacterium]|jgi:CheY-like chemotaxis protein
MPLSPRRAKLEKVLVVDDEPDIRRVGQMSLELVGQLKVLLASGGEEALSIAAEEQPDVILLDVMMPRLDGPATLALLRSAPATADIPVIFMTAKVQKYEIDGYLAGGAKGVIFKPFDPMTLSQEIGRIAFSG